MPSSFTLTQTSTGNAWTTNVGTGQIRDGNWGGDPVLTLVPSQPSDIYSARNPGIWYRLAGSGNYVRHSGYVMWTQGYSAGSFDFAWAFFLKNGTNNQVIVWNPFPGDGVGNWVQSGTYTPGRIAINTQNPALAYVYTISTPVPLTQMSGTSLFSQLSTSASASAVGAFSLRAINGTTARAVQVQRSSDNATQDFWADRLGNLLTAPVTGQTLANWLGSATGNVTTWYDQSGQGKDMSQPTAAYQPAINLTTSPYSLTFNGSTSNMYNTNFTFNFGTSYQYTIRAVINNTTGGCLLYKGSSGAPWSLSGMKKWWLGSLNGGEASTGGYPNLVGYSEGYVFGQSAITSTKSSVTWVSSAFSSVTLYENAAGVTVSYARNSQNADPGTYLYMGVGGNSAYYAGNIYEIEIFSTPLSASDVTIMG